METANRKMNNPVNGKKKKEPTINGMAYEMEYRGTIEKSNIIPINAYRPSEQDMGIEISAGTYVVELDEKTAQRIVEGKVINLELKKIEKMKEEREKEGKVINLEKKKAERAEKANTRSTGTDR